MQAWKRPPVHSVSLRSNLSRIEAGKHRPTLETLEKLVAALKIPVAELIADR